MLLSRDRFCLSDRYTLQVYCGTRNGGSLDRFGGEGEGPGEFRGPVILKRDPAGSLVAVDVGLARLSVFGRDNELLRTAQLLPFFRPISHFGDSTAVGIFESFRSDSVAEIARIATGDGRVLQRWAFRPPEGRTFTAEPIPLAAMAPWGEMIVFFTGAGYVLDRYSPDGSYEGSFTQPAYRPELPSRREVEEYRSAYEHFTGYPIPAPELEAWAARPKIPLMAAPMKEGPNGSLWVPTRRDQERASYIDIFGSVGYLGSVRVRDRLVSFDIYDDVLAILVERIGHGEIADPDLGLDWYLVSDYLDIHPTSAASRDEQDLPLGLGSRNLGPVGPEENVDLGAQARS